MRNDKTISESERETAAGATHKGPAPAARGIASRRLAVEALIQVEQDNAYANLALASAFKRKSLQKRDRAFVTALVQGVLRHRTALDEAIARLSSQPLEKMPAPLRNILRLALFQLLHMPDIPESAVVDTASKLARAMGHPGTVKFTNGLLRAYLRQRGEPDKAQVLDISDARRLATTHSMPVWLVERWLERWGNEETVSLLEFTQQVPELTLRACQMAISTDGLAQVLDNGGVKYRRGKLVDACLIVEERGTMRGPVQQLKGYADGLFTVQDEAAAFVGIVVAPEKGNLVVDLCAAPGGKSLHLGEIMEGKGRVVAVDSHPGRLNLLRRNRQRLGLANIETVVADGATFVLPNPADRVLLDAPCTGTGVINRRSDLRFQRQEPDLASLVALQRALLTNAATLVKPGGILVYSTCSLEPEENEENMRWFLGEHKEFAPDSLVPFVPQALASEWSQGNHALNLDKGFIQLMPSRHGLSGFFVCRLKRAPA